jgi:glyoxylase-like metal-dependent hydrolase (beta-lactamase superfamily II)
MGKVPHYLNDIPKDKEIVTICPLGNRSGITTFLLHRLGYNVKTLQEGLKSWSSTFEYAIKEFNVDSKQKIEKLKVVQVRRIGKGCMSYVIGIYADKKEEGERQVKETVIIDPVFPINEYLRIANVEFGSLITKVFDTHLHADHVSAARDLAKKVNAELYLSSYEDYSFVKEEEKKYNEKVEHEHEKCSLLQEGDIYNVGSKENEIILKVIHTPGHTEGGISFLVGNKLLFTGDTLFVDNIGRPDLRDKAEEFATMLYNTLHNKIFSLSNKEEILVFPAHIDKNVREEEIVTATLADIEKRSKYLNLKKDEFVKRMTSVIMPTPPQYKEIIDMNKGEKPLLLISEIQDLEMGPNRCSISS